MRLTRSTNRQQAARAPDMAKAAAAPDVAADRTAVSKKEGKSSSMLLAKARLSKLKLRRRKANPMGAAATLSGSPASFSECVPAPVDDVTNLPSRASSGRKRSRTLFYNPSGSSRGKKAPIRHSSSAFGADDAENSASTNAPLRSVRARLPAQTQEDPAVAFPKSSISPKSTTTKKETEKRASGTTSLSKRKAKNKDAKEIKDSTEMSGPGASKEITRQEVEKVAVAYPRAKEKDRLMASTERSTLKLRKILKGTGNGSQNARSKHDMTVEEADKRQGESLDCSQTNTQNSKTQPHYQVGTEICKVFDDASYRGEVISFDSAAKFYKIRYVDGDEEELDENELKCHLVPDQTTTKKTRRANRKAAGSRNLERKQGASFKQGAKATDNKLFLTKAIVRTEKGKKRKSVSSSRKEDKHTLTTPTTTMPLKSSSPGRNGTPGTDAMDSLAFIGSYESCPRSSPSKSVTKKSEVDKRGASARKGQRRSSATHTSASVLASNEMVKSVEAEFLAFERARLKGEKQTVSLRIQRLKDEIKVLEGKKSSSDVSNFEIAFEDARKITWKKFECANLEGEEKRLAGRLNEISNGSVAMNGVVTKGRMEVEESKSKDDNPAKKSSRSSKKKGSVTALAQELKGHLPKKPRQTVGKKAYVNDAARKRQAALKKRKKASNYRLNSKSSDDDAESEKKWAESGGTSGEFIEQEENLQSKCKIQIPGKDKTHSATHPDIPPLYIGAFGVEMEMPILGGVKSCLPRLEGEHSSAAMAAGQHWDEPAVEYHAPKNDAESLSDGVAGVFDMSDMEDEKSNSGVSLCDGEASRKPRCTKTIPPSDEDLHVPGQIGESVRIEVPPVPQEVNMQSRKETVINNAAQMARDIRRRERSGCLYEDAEGDDEDDALSFESEDMFSNRLHEYYALPPPL